VLLSRDSSDTARIIFTLAPDSVSKTDFIGTLEMDSQKPLYSPLPSLRVSASYNSSLARVRMRVGSACCDAGTVLLEGTLRNGTVSGIWRQEYYSERAGGRYTLTYLH
jgi:hypothetical protein